MACTRFSFLRLQCSGAAGTRRHQHAYMSPLDFQSPAMQLDMSFEFHIDKNFLLLVIVL
jgi:hypothetical protein